MDLPDDLLRLLIEAGIVFIKDGTVVFDLPLMSDLDVWLIQNIGNDPRNPGVQKILLERLKTLTSSDIDYWKIAQYLTLDGRCTWADLRPVVEAARQEFFNRTPKKMERWLLELGVPKEVAAILRAKNDRIRNRQSQLNRSRLNQANRDH